MNSYDVIDEYGYEVPLIIDDVINKIFEIEKVNNSYFSICFVDNAKIREINKLYRNIDRETDVISFAFNDAKDSVSLPINMLGEIFISIPKMIDQADEYGHSSVREISFLITHGLLHLLGYDHIEKCDEEVMFQKQEEVLNEFEETKKNRNK